MPTETELLAAIYAAPDDDGPRLVYGDWLQAKSDPRGELIQVQCRLADESQEPLAPAEKRKLRTAENKLLKIVEPICLAPIRQISPASAEAFSPPKVELRRGFVQRLRAPIAILRRIDELFAIAPLLTELQLEPTPYTTAYSGLEARDLASPLLSRLRSLNVNLALDDTTIAMFAKCPHLANLRELLIGGSRWVDTGEVVTIQGAKALASSPYLEKNLRSLYVEDNRLGDEGVEALFRGGWKLETLHVGNNDCTGQLFRSLASAKELATLKRLSVRQTDGVTPADAALLAGAKNLPSLVALDIEKCQIGPQGVAAFLDALALPLEELIIASNALGDAGGTTLAACKKLERLRVLDVTKNRLGKKAVTAIATTPHFANLSKLLVNDRESDESREALATSTTLASAQVYYRGRLLAKAGAAGADGDA